MREMDDDELILRDWGVPDDLLPFSGLDPNPARGDEPRPLLWLPDGWRPDSDPALSRVREAIDAGMGVSLPGYTDVFDLHSLEQSVTELTILWCLYDPAATSGLELLREMHKLRGLRAPNTTEQIDLSQLPELRDVSIHGPALLSALAAPALRTASASVPSLTDEVRLSPTIDTLGLSAKVVDIESISRSLPDLISLTIDGARALDFAPLAQLRSLRELKVMNVGSISGLETFAKSARLDSLSIDRVAVLDEPAALLQVNATRAEAMGSPDLDANFQTAAEKLGRRWYVEPPRRPRSRSRFVIDSAPDGFYEISFTDWDAPSADVNADGDSAQMSGHDLERLLSAVQQSIPALRAIPVTYDSEGDAFHALVHERKQAVALRTAWDKFLRNRSV